MRKLGALLLALLLVVSLAACGNTTTETKEPETKQEETKTDTKETGEEAKEEKELGDTINYALNAQPPTLDAPQTVSQAALNIAANFYETLYTQDKDYNPQPMLATGYTANEDNTEFTFTLRENVKFHDGHIMNADDVVASMNYWLEKSSRAKNLLGEGAFEKVDDLTVVAKFKNPANTLMNLMSSRANFPAIRTKAAIEAAGETGVTDYNGTGPFIFKEWKQDDYIHLVKNPDYVPLDEPANGFAGKRVAEVENLYFRIVPDASTRISGMLAGTYDITSDIPSDQYEDVKNAENLKVYTSEGGTLTMFFNVNQGPLANFDMRKAVVTGLNNEEMMLASFIYPDLYTMGQEYMNPKMAQWKTDAGKDMYNINDPEKAKEMLKAAGYNGETIKLLGTQDYPEMYNATLVLQDQLKKLGMEVTLESYDFPTFMEKKGDFNNWDIYITSNGYQVTPQQLLVVNPDWAGANDPKLKAMVDELKSYTDPEQQSKKWEEIQSFLYDEYLSSIAIGQYNEVVVVSDKVEGFELAQAPIFWNTKIYK